MVRSSDLLGDRLEGPVTPCVGAQVAAAADDPAVGYCFVDNAADPHLTGSSIARSGLSHRRMERVRTGETWKVTGATEPGHGMGTGSGQSRAKAVHQGQLTMAAAPL